MDLYDDSDSSEGGEHPAFEFAIHNAVEAGDMEALASLLKPPMPTANDDDAGSGPPPRLHVPGVNARDAQECTPLHLAILLGRLEAVQALLAAGASLSMGCEGSPPLVMAACMGSHPTRQRFALAVTSMLMDAGAVPFERRVSGDDWGRTALHWAAFLGLTDVAQLLLTQADAVAKAESARDPEAPAIPKLTDFQDKVGDTALHLAARYARPDVVRLLLRAGAAPRARNKAGRTAAHGAALGGCAASAGALAAADSGCAGLKDRRGVRAGALAAARGFPAVAEALRAGGIASEDGDADARVTEVSEGNAKQPQTLVLAPPECWAHHTAAWPRLRHAVEPPPENVGRLAVLTGASTGSLRGEEAGRVAWDESSRRVALADLLRVHDWTYVRSVQRACDSLPRHARGAAFVAAHDAAGVVKPPGGGVHGGDPDAPLDSEPNLVGGEPAPPGPAITEDMLGFMDGDTAMSSGTWAAALAAAGAATAAVDAVMSGTVRNAFCAVRPPGHHAGPQGAVSSARDPNATNGFCLFNSVAVAAAYARCVHRHAGVARVALVDFDVHHGNGTEACVVRATPGVQRIPLTTPFSEGSMAFPIYSPWLDADDRDCIFFASVQGFGPKAPGLAAYVYPGSGANADNRPGVVSTGGGASMEGGVVNTGGGVSMDDTASSAPLPEDPDVEFAAAEDEPGAAPAAAPRVIDVGIAGPGTRAGQWRRAWRDKILPALVNFRPDFIFVSAGFDAHRKDEMNYRFVGVTERDYEWLTDQLVQVANRCCAGRLVSVLEGGYRIHGGRVSAFARSVAAHVRALAEPHRQAWAADEAEWERAHEKAMRAEAETKRMAAAAAAEEAARAAAEAAAAQTGHRESGGDAGPVDQPGVKDLADTEAGAAKRRRRGGSGVDYVALNKVLEEEAAARQKQSTA